MLYSSHFIDNKIWYKFVPFTRWNCICFGLKEPTLPFHKLQAHFNFVVLQNLIMICCHFYCGCNECVLNQKPFNQQNGFWVGHQRLIVRKVLFYALFIPRPIRQANTVMTILGLTSTRSSGRA